MNNWVLQEQEEKEDVKIRGDGKSKDTTSTMSNSLQCCVVMECEFLFWVCNQLFNYKLVLGQNEKEKGNNKGKIEKEWEKVTFNP